MRNSVITGWCLGMLLLVGVHARAQSFSLPAVPDSLATPAARAAYLATHYWDAFVAPGSLPADAEQVLADFLGVLSAAPDSCRHRAVQTWLQHSPDAGLTAYWFEQATLYLGRADSPYRNEALLQEVVSAFAVTPTADAATHSRAVFLQRQLSLNPPGDAPADFRMERRDGKVVHLHALLQDIPTLLLFYDPECAACVAHLFALRHDSALRQAIAEGREQVIAVCLTDDTARWLQSAHDLPATWQVVRDRTDVRAHNLYYLPELPVTLRIIEGKVIRNK